MIIKLLSDLFRRPLKDVRDLCCILQCEFPDVRGGFIGLLCFSRDSSLPVYSLCFRTQLSFPRDDFDQVSLLLQEATSFACFNVDADMSTSDRFRFVRMLCLRFNLNIDACWRQFIGNGQDSGKLSFQFFL